MKTLKKSTYYSVSIDGNTPSYNLVSSLKAAKKIRAEMYRKDRNLEKQYDLEKLHIVKIQIEAVA